MKQSKQLSSVDFARGCVIREPVGFSKGHWVGAPGAYYAADEKAWYLTYRIRRPRGVEPDRGGEARIARSTDLQHWNDVWSVTKDKYNTASIERSAIRKGADGQWRYFTGFVDPADGRWCVAALMSPDVEKFDPAKARQLFTAKALGLEGVKDPWILEVGGLFHMLLSVAVPTAKTGAASHETLDIFNTGECVSATGLAVSRDLDNWDWQGVIFGPDRTGWDVYCRRLNSVVRERGEWLGFYDGSASHRENYEEKTGLAVSTNLRSWKPTTAAAPAFTSPQASGSLRYVDAQLLGSDVHFFYEFARADGAHDLRYLKANRGSLPFDILPDTAS